MVTVERITTPEGLRQCQSIRSQVFVDTGNCPPDVQFEQDDEAEHYLALYNGQPAGTCRYRITPKGYKLERFAVLPAFRGKGIASQLLNHLLALFPKGSYTYLHAQAPAVPLYLKAGFNTVGDSFDEIGIPHYKMERTV